MADSQRPVVFAWFYDNSRFFQSGLYGADGGHQSVHSQHGHWHIDAVKAGLKQFGSGHAPRPASRQAAGQREGVADVIDGVGAGIRQNFFVDFAVRMFRNRDQIGGRFVGVIFGQQTSDVA